MILIDGGLNHEKKRINSTSPRKGGNSDTLAEEFAKGAREAGHEVEKIGLWDKTIGFCRGCLACQKTGRCVIRDDAEIIARKMLTEDVIVYATPIYYCEMSGQMKIMLDWGNPLYSSDYAFREIYLLATAADTDESTMDGAVKVLEGWIACFAKARLAGTVFSGGADAIGTIKGNPALTKAYETGKAV